jgi:hypothetical protein
MIQPYSLAKVDTSRGYPAIGFTNVSSPYHEIKLYHEPDITLAGAYTVEVLLSASNLTHAINTIISKNFNFIIQVTSAGVLKAITYNGAWSTLTCSPAISINTLYHVEMSAQVGAPTLVFINGVYKGSLPEGATDQGFDLAVGGDGYSFSNAFVGTMRVRLTKGVARHTTTDNFTPPTTFFVYLPRFPRRAVLEQPWGIKIGAELRQAWGDTPVVRAVLAQPWGNADLLRADLLQRWESSFSLRGTLHQGWNIYGVLRAELEQRWAITADLVRGVLEQGWDLRERDLLRAELSQRWAIEADGAVLRYTATAMVDGVPLGFNHLNIEAGRDGDVMSCELHLGSEADYLRCALGAALAITITSDEGSEQFVFEVTAPRPTEEHGNTQYIVEAESPAVVLGGSYADPVEDELSGLASVIAATLAGPVPIAWDTVDWEIPPATWSAAGEAPLTLLKALAVAVGAVVQSLPDGSLRIEPEYPASVHRWGACPPGLTLVENLDCFTTGSTPEIQPGYNRFLVGDQLTSGSSLRIEEESVSAAVKLVRGYQTPWTGLFELRHTGGPWVVIEPLGVEERQETETIEIVGGAGRVGYPIYSRDAVQWGQHDLGTVAVGEDGSVLASVAGESLLTITYTTRCLLWRVRNVRNEQLQLVVPA